MKNIATALVKAQKAFGPALKTSTNPHFRTRYANLSACVEAVIDALNDNGIFLLQKNYDCDNGIMVETVFVHESGEMLECGIVRFPAVKQDPQGYASALTYGRRYSLMAACGIAPEDDDGNAATKSFQAPAANPLDTIAPKANAPVYELAIPGKESRLYETEAFYSSAVIKMRDAIEKSDKMSARLKMTKLRELKEANESQIDKLDTAVRAKLVSDYGLRLKRLGSQIEPGDDATPEQSQ